MKTRNLVLLTLLTCFTFSSCNKKELRSDIQEFVSDFKLETAVEHYKKVEMNRVVETNDNGSLTKEIETLTFDINDVNKPLYHHQIDTYKGEELQNTSMSYLEHVDEKIYYVANSSTEEMSLEEAHNLIKSFFYSKTYLDGQYHDRGYYYGDILLNNIYEYQNFVTINEEQTLLTIEISRTQDGVLRKSKIVVDKFGMIVQNIASAKRDNQESTTTISIKHYE